MFYWLTDLSDKISFFNVFRYITFRTGGAIVTALVFVFLFGGPIIDLLRLKQGKGQPIRSDGPQSHLVTKKGTPTMGGLMILSGLLVSTLLWANPKNPYVWVVLGVTLSFGMIGFYDDYLKITKQTHAGFAGRTRLIIETIIAVAACTALAQLGGVAPPQGHASDLVSEIASRLTVLNRYERRALSRRKFAIRDFDACARPRQDQNGETNSKIINEISGGSRI